MMDKQTLKERIDNWLETGKHRKGEHNQKRHGWRGTDLDAARRAMRSGVSADFEGKTTPQAERDAARQRYGLSKIDRDAQAQARAAAKVEAEEKRKPDTGDYGKLNTIHLREGVAAFSFVSSGDPMKRIQMTKVSTESGSEKQVDYANSLKFSALKRVDEGVASMLKNPRARPAVAISFRNRLMAAIDSDVSARSIIDKLKSAPYLEDIMNAYGIKVKE